MGLSKQRVKNSETPSTEMHSISPSELLILEMLVGSGRELYGLEMVKASSGKLKRGAIYIMLRRMQEKGLIGSRPEPLSLPEIGMPEIGMPRRLYSITGYGQRVYQASQTALIELTLQHMSY